MWLEERKKEAPKKTSKEQQSQNNWRGLCKGTQLDGSFVCER